MHRIALLAVIAAASADALASTPIDQTLEADADGLLDVQNISGSVTITGTNRNSVHVTGELSDDAERIDIRRDGDRVVVHVIMPENWGRGRRNFETTNLRIEAPRDMSVDVDTVSAAIKLQDMRGEKALNSVSGSIESDLYGAEIRAKTVSGRIRFSGDDAQTRADVSSVSGDVELETISGEVTAQTVSGRIEIESPLLERGDLQSVSGSIDVEAALAENARLRAVATSGHISLRMLGDGAGSYELSSFSGSIDNCFGPQPARAQFGPPNSSLQFEEGDSGARVNANSMSGTIELCRGN